MKLSEFDYILPRELIAQKPMNPRDHSRLLLLDKKTGKINHKHFYDILDYLQAGDVLVLNNSKVFPARLIGSRKETGGKLEVFLLRSMLLSKHALHRGHMLRNKSSDVCRWQCLIGGRRVRPGLAVKFAKGLEGEIVKDNEDGASAELSTRTWEVKFNLESKEMMKVVEKIGQVPLPPYIKRGKGCLTPKGVTDTTSYQTVYAEDKKVGSVAAPTAGFHFTSALIKKLKAKGVQFEYVTLHVGLGTFAPVKVDNIKQHKMHAEFVEVSKETIARIYLAKHEKRRIVAVGTTSVRTLEAIVSKYPIINNQYPRLPKPGTGGQANNIQYSITKFSKQFSDFREMVDIFIYPGFKFKIVDAIITNFHLPKSTLLMLVSAFAGKINIDKAYKSAIRKKYRFYSYGDAMLIY